MGTSGCGRRGLVAGAGLVWAAQGMALASEGEGDGDAVRLEGLFAEAGRLRREGRSEEALAVWEEAIRVAPRNPAARSNRGGLLLQVGRWEEAEAELAESVRLEREALALGYTLAPSAQAGAARAR